MAHKKDSKTERIQLKIDSVLEEFFKAISDEDPKSEKCKTKLADFFLRYGIYSAFTEHFFYDLSNFEYIHKILKKIVDGNEFNRILNRVERREKRE